MRRSRGVTLVEVLITVTIIALLSGVTILGIGVTSGARLKRSATMVVGAIRVAYAHANATSKPVRLVFDFENRLIILEEATGQLQLVKHDKTGGAEAATEAEKAAQDEAEAIVKGPRAPRPAFKPAKAFGFDPKSSDTGISGEDKPGKELSKGIRFHSVETTHTDEPELADHAYLYFWPGGQTERAAIVLTKGDGDNDDDSDFLTILVSPLTGKAELKAGKQALVRPRDESEESEREDTGF